MEFSGERDAQSSLPEMTAENSQRSLQQLEEALDLISHDDKAAYLEARERCPWLVEREPGLMRFLHYDRFNFWEAARRVAKYWTIRKELFGDDRAFLPMHQTGNGALSHADRELLSTGFASVLANDSGGRCVGCYIPSRLPASDSTSNGCKDELFECRKRCIFYIQSLIMEHSHEEKPEWTGILVFNSVGFQRLSGRSSQTAEIMRNLPMYIEKGFLVHCPTDVQRKTFLERIAPSVLNALPDEGGRMQVVAASSLEDVSNQLVLDYGFKSENLPPECGGTWTMDDFREWQRQRIKLERERERQYANLSVAAGKPIVIPVPNQALAEIVAREEPLGKKTTANPESTRSGPNKASAQKVNQVVRSQKNMKAPPRNAQFDKDAAIEVTTEDGIVASAAVLAAAAATGKKKPSVEDIERELTRAYSRQKWQKRKEKVSALQTSHADKVEENKRLKKESVRLEALLREAEALVMNHIQSTASVSSTLFGQLQQPQPGNPFTLNSFAMADLQPQAMGTACLQQHEQASIPLFSPNIMPQNQQQQQQQQPVVPFGTALANGQQDQHPLQLGQPPFDAQTISQLQQQQQQMIQPFGQLQSAHALANETVFNSTTIAQQQQQQQQQPGASHHPLFAQTTHLQYPGALGLTTNAAHLMQPQMAVAQLHQEQQLGDRTMFDSVSADLLQNQHQQHSLLNGTWPTPLAGPLMAKSNGISTVCSQPGTGLLESSSGQTGLDVSSSSSRSTATGATGGFSNEQMSHFQQEQLFHPGAQFHN